MAGFLVVHCAHCAKNIMSILFAFLRRKHDFNKTKHLIGESICDTWASYRAMPLTAARKEAMKHVNNGARCYNAKRFDEALALFREATYCDPSYARAHMYMGNALYKMNQQGDAVKAWERAVAVEPNSKAAFNAHAKLERLRTQQQRAIHELREQIKK